MPISPKTHRAVKRTRSNAKHEGTRTERGYDNVWLRLSRMCLTEEPYCRYCARLGRTVVAEVSDHIIPIRIRPDLRLVRANIQSLCKRCHDSTKQQEEKELWG